MPLSDIKLIILQNKTFWRLCDEVHRNFERIIVIAWRSLIPWVEKPEIWRLFEVKR